MPLFLLALALLGGSTWAVYGRALNSPFVFDDRFSVLENPSIVSLWPLWGNAAHPGPLNPPKDLPTSGRPLANFSLALNCHFGHFDPVGYHLFNLIVQVLSALVLMAIVNRTLHLEYFGGSFDGAAGLLSLSVALIWTLHPLQTETIVYVTQRTELLVGCFYLATIYGSLRYWGAASSAGRTTWLILTTLACMAGMACKEVMATAPLIVLLLERTFITGSFRRAMRSSWPLYVGLALGWCLLVWLNCTAPRSNSAGFRLGVPATAWWFTQAEVLWMYLELAVWPWPQTIYYEIPYLTTVSAAWPWLLLTALLIIGTLLLICRRNSIGFVGAWVLLILSPTMVVPIITEVAAERRMYLPLAALAALVIVGGYRLAQLAAGESRATARARANRRSTVLIAAMVAILAVIFSVASVRRLAAYHDELTLWQDNLMHHPDNPIAHINVGDALLAAKRPEEAIQQYQLALHIRPNSADAHNNLGMAFAATGRLPEAIAEFKQALRLKPGYRKAQNNLGDTLNKSGQTEEAIQLQQEALRLKPDDAEVHYNFGNTLIDAGRPQEAIGHFQQALRLNPNYAEAHLNLGAASAKAGRLQEAIDHYQQALRIKPDYAEAHSNLGTAFAQVGQLPQAIEQFREALRLQPDLPAAQNNLNKAINQSAQLSEAIDRYQQAVRANPNDAEAHYNLASALLKSGRPQEAMDRYQEAVRVKPDYAEARASLAIALARMNRTDEAIAMAQTALELARSRGQAALAQQIENWLRSYRTNK